MPHRYVLSTIAYLRKLKFYDTGSIPFHACFATNTSQELILGAFLDDVSAS